MRGHSENAAYNCEIEHPFLRGDHVRLDPSDLVVKTKDGGDLSAVEHSHPPYSNFIHSLIFTLR
jgi:hypothetical protein